MAVYNGLVRYLTPEERVKVEKSLEELPEKERCMSLFLKAIGEGSWDALPPRYSEYGLLAVKTGQMAIEAFAMVQTYWQMQEAHRDKESIERVSLFDSKAREMIGQTMRIVNTKGVLLTDFWVGCLIEKMRQAPKCQQSIWIVPDIQRSECWGLTLSLRIYTETGMNIFSRLPNGKRMIAPFTLVQELLNLAFGTNAVRLRPALGSSPLEGIRDNGIRGERDVAFGYPLVPLPAMAHEVGTPHSDFTEHDLLYHSYIASCVPQELRVTFIEISDIALKYLAEAKDSLTQEKLTTLRARCIDMECNRFRMDVRGGRSLNELFWRQLYDYHPLIRVFLNDEEKKKAFFTEITQLLKTKPLLQDGPYATFAKVLQESNHEQINTLAIISQLWT